MTFMEFVKERHRIWLRRLAGSPQPWTEDPILASHKFTNVFRVLDPGSQFVFDLAGHDDDPFDVLARLFLYRHTNLPSAWRAYAAEFGEYPRILEFPKLLKFWREYRDTGGQLFSGAYMVYPQSSTPGTEKIASVISLVHRVAENGSFRRFLDAPDQVTRYRALRANKGVADFMSMQILTDWGYTPHCDSDRENEFVVPGPGSKRGALLLRPHLKPETTIRWAREAFLRDPDAPILGQRPLSLMDVQNCFCEFSKYVKKTPGKPYRAAHPGPQPAPRLPESWSNA